MNHRSDPIDFLSDERQFLENLLNTRANFSLVIFGLALAAAGTLGTIWLQFAVLAASAVLSAILAFTITRAQWKLDLVIQELPENHPAREIEKIADCAASKLSPCRRFFVRKSLRRLIGYFIPWATTVMLLAGAIAAPLGVFQAATGQETPTVLAEVKELRQELQALRDSVSVIRSQAGMARRVSP